MDATVEAHDGEVQMIDTSIVPFLDEDKVFGEALNGPRGLLDEPRA
jgi:hypothetical protein